MISSDKIICSTPGETGRSQRLRLGVLLAVELNVHKELIK